MKKEIDLNDKIKLYLQLLNTKFSKNDLEKLEAWRGFLAFIVILAHANQVFIAPIIGTENHINWSFGFAAHFAVLGFFVVSGIAITMSIVLNINRNNGFLNLRQYIVARISRIYPPLILSVVLCVLFYYIIHYFNFLGATQSCKLIEDKYVAREFFTFTFGDVRDSLLFKNDALTKVNGPLWSLVIEWWIYFLIVFLVGTYFLKNKFLKLLSFIIFLLILKKLVHLNGLAYVFIWIMGSCFYIFYNIKYKYITFILGLIGIITCNFYFNFYNKMTDVSTLPLVQIFISVLFLSFILKFPKKSIFNKIANFSYTLYVIHFPFFLFIFFIFHDKTQNSIYVYLLEAIFSIIFILYASYKFSIFFENKKYFSLHLDKIINFFDHKLKYNKQ